MTHNRKVTDLAIHANRLSKRFGRVWALANVSFDLPRGKVLLVAGKNGSGKSTLFRVLTTAIRADGGAARVAGADLSAPFLVRRRTALLSHHGYVYESLTAMDNMNSFARLAGIDISGVPEILRAVGLADRKDEPIRQFSAGMRKRLAIARLLLQIENGSGEVVFLDEPYAALDPDGLMMIDDLVRRLRNSNRTVLIASHLLERSASLATDAILLDTGCLIWSGSPGELVSRGHLHRMVESA